MKRLLSGLALGCIAALPVAASAQTLEEVVVTAQRREQSLQDVPVSVTAFSGTDIEQYNIKSATDYLSVTPNVSFTEDGQFGKRGAGIAIRGVNNLVSGENAAVPSIGIYLDEFSVASVPNQFANPQIPDMERIEVLRGPQGTYFGRNAVGGALNLTTRAPEDEFEARVTVGAETYDEAGEQVSLGGMVNLPLAENFALRGVVTYEDNSGWVENICAAGSTRCFVAQQNNFTPNGAEDSGHEYLSLRLKALWDVSDNTSITGTFIWADEEQGHDENVPSGILDLDSVDTLGVQQAVDPGTGFWPNNRNLLSHDAPERNELETIIGIINVTHQFNDNLTLKWITGAIDAEFDRLFDNDLVGGVDAITRDNLYEGSSASSELRLESTGERLDWVVGAMVSRDDQDQRNNVAVSSRPTDTIAGVGFLPPFPQGLGLALNTKSFEIDGLAVFGDLTFHATDRLDFVLGGRFSRDEVTNFVQSNGIQPGPNSCPPPVDIVCFFQGFINAPRPAASGEETFNDFAPRVGVRFQWYDNVGLYATISKGYKAGGTSVGNNTNAPGQPAFIVPYDEETLWNYEVGVKSEIWDNRLRLNAAIFFLQWEDMQFESFRFLTPGDLSSNFEQTINIDEGEANGLEVEFEALLTENFSLSGAVGILDGELDNGGQLIELTGGYQVNVDGLDIPKAPELTWNLAGEYRWPLDAAEGWIRLEFIYRDGQYSDIEGVTNLQTRGASPNSGFTLSRPVGPNQFPYLSPDYNLVNLRGGYEGERWSFQFYVQNMLDEEYYTGTQENFGASGIRLRPHPRVIGGNVSFNF